MPGQFGPISRVLLPFHGAFHFDHVVDGNAFGDADDQIEAGIDAFQNGVGGKRRRNEDGRSGGAGLLHGLGDGIEDRDFVFEELAALAGRDAGDDLRAVGEAQLGVAGAEAAGDALNENFGFGSDEDRHDRISWQC